ncbi:hypothetical protein LDE05_16700 [Lactobacillus delbrueckii subsp. bulgaricus]|uniref:EpsIIL, Putative polysaccharide repeat unit transport protein n=1 Tax=Lactobacillus delbrueckii subsp. bulgaricus (strain ATCC 11842 / DSM 20081 / BCRC 10696 / JCM 1002 / NBRC 13953 / NCIMB 11778 / NCTC 12712 / WDCM 00102 / Lb 14) TaxID=390333 RepID=Q1G8I8_LACDA|nr:oligosaccharide flippase family protein [Lactobacillus delbrueckii]KRN36628.1 polysaccharide repeat-containing transporter [Lactobacillus delbrueckii subsp. bulgaricus ATCC 11842 = JCM 1002]MDG9749056.1 oligosaccharide flippase family protein [Lactobacillus delbrueckii subsp. bulgaricus ATCC 11842 = JCM 1002]GEB91807.1 hypothetical protein LDE05_16700 [Lactobacillus delbrueckii subsp. bulgaricus]CAI98677.1 EpsIIL, Putative polysaccharide repeat unit transport protein [Lactobacillus delbrueck
MNNPSIKKNIFISTLYQVLSIITPLVTAPYVSRVIGTDGIGAYSWTSSIQTYFSLVAALGTLSYGMREIARNRNDVKKRSQIFWEIEMLSVFTSLAMLLLWGIYLGFQSHYRVMFLILTLNLFNTMLDISWFFDGLEQFQYTVTKNALVKVAGVILILLFVKTPKDTNLYVFIMTGTTLLGTMSMWLELHKFVVKVPIKLVNLKRHFHETLIYFIPTIATSIYTYMDKTLIGFMTQNNAENAYYEQATKIINLTKAVTFTAVNNVLGARISYLFAKKNEKEIKQRIQGSINYILFIGVGIGFGLLGIADTFVPVFFGHGWDKVALLLRLFSPQIVIIGISNCLGSQYYNPAGLRKQSAVYIIIGAVINFVLNLFLIPRFASAGATFASIIAELTISLLYLCHDNGYLELVYIGKVIWKKLIAGTLMMLVILALNPFGNPGIIKLGIQFVLGAGTYLATLFIMKDDSVGLLKKILGRG